MNIQIGDKVLIHHPEKVCLGSEHDGKVVEIYKITASIDNVKRYFFTHDVDNSGHKRSNFVRDCSIKTKVL